MARILVADDAAMLRVLVCRSLFGHKTIEAEDGTEALELTRQHRPDIVILDWVMPGMTGVEVARAIREDASLSHIQIIMMTARSGFDSEDQAKAAGVDHFITKPIMPRQVSTLVDKILTARQARP